MPTDEHDDWHSLREAWNGIVMSLRGPLLKKIRYNKVKQGSA